MKQKKQNNKSQVHAAPTGAAFSNYYMSQRNPRNTPKKKPKHKIRYIILIVLLVIAGVILLRNHKAASTTALNTKTSSAQTHTTDKTPTPKTPPNACASNSLPKEVIVSISQRRTWACDGTTVAYTSLVITGNENIPSDLTPTGTYHIQAKQTNVNLIGCDIDDPTDCWNDFVHYDMIFLYNQYGHYDLHDATWRTSGDFGNISPYSANASHGCVEMPLATAAWLYNWTDIGTAVVIQA